MASEYASSPVAQPGTHTIRPLNFSYFDPGARRYETATSSPLSVTVSPAADSASNEPPPPAGPGGASPAAGASADASHSGLRPEREGAVFDEFVDAFVRFQIDVLHDIWMKGQSSGRAFEQIVDDAHTFAHRLQIFFGIGSQLSLFVAFEIVEINFRRIERIL